jgi:anti-anti-sigma factor
MNGDGESRRPDTDETGPTVIIRHDSKRTSSEVAVLHLDKGDRETEVARFPTGPRPDFRPPDISTAVHYEIENGARRFIVDLGQATSVNSTGLGWLIQLWTTIKDSGGLPVLIVTSDRILEVLETTKLNQLFHICDSLASGKRYLDRTESEHGA